ncbi:MAG: hypothetical protein M3Z10_09200, partial [Gemmatimonadota bacterium]|nr:hypothetical protein [Gemmatimonadota bacterium]
MAMPGAAPVMWEKRPAIVTANNMVIVVLTADPVRRERVRKVGGDAQPVSRLLAQYVHALTAQASDMMSGYFAIFEDLDENVRA